jgi:hypothetical protein
MRDTRSCDYAHRRKKRYVILRWIYQQNTTSSLRQSHGISSLSSPLILSNHVIISLTCTLPLAARHATTSPRVERL